MKISVFFPLVFHYGPRENAYKRRPDNINLFGGRLNLKTNFSHQHFSKHHVYKIAVLILKEKTLFLKNKNTFIGSAEI